MASPYQLAASIAGTREGQSALTDYLKTGGQSLDPQSLAWCAAFVNATMAQAGQKGTDSNMARSFLKWGQAVSQPQQGDVAVFSRGDPNGPYGHVGFYSGTNPDGSIKVLGGNQSDSVSYASYPADRLLGFRRAGPGTVGGDSMVARDHDPQVAGQTNTPMNPPMGGGLLAGPQQQGINPELAALAGEDEDKAKLGGLLSAIGKAIPNAPQPNLGPMPDARQTGGLLTKYLSTMKGRA